MVGGVVLVLVLVDDMAVELEGWVWVLNDNVDVVAVMDDASRWWGEGVLIIEELGGTVILLLLLLLLLLWLLAICNICCMRDTICCCVDAIQSHCILRARKDA